MVLTPFFPFAVAFFAAAVTPFRPLLFGAFGFLGFGPSDSSALGSSTAALALALFVGTHLRFGAVESDICDGQSNFPPLS